MKLTMRISRDFQKRNRQFDVVETILDDLLSTVPRVMLSIRIYQSISLIACMSSLCKSTSLSCRLRVAKIEKNGTNLRTLDNLELQTISALSSSSLVALVSIRSRDWVCRYPTGEIRWRREVSVLLHASRIELAQ